MAERAPLWVAIEGIEGVGKTYLGERLWAHLGPRCMFIREVTEQRAPTVADQVVTALSAAGDVFLRTGHPLTETFALLALKAHAYSQALAAVAASKDTPGIVLEDRGPDTVAVYQPAILQPLASASHAYELTRLICATIERWRPLPDLAVLIVDDVEVCAQRFASRLGRPVQADELALMRRASELYARQAAAEPGRFHVVDRRGRSEVQTLAELTTICTQRMEGRCAAM
jgi:dTMP kinase